MSGYFAVSRDIFDHPLVGQDAERLRFWLILLSKAHWKRSRVEVAGQVITLDRGQLCTSVRKLAKETGGTRTGTARFLDRLKTGTGDGPMIEVDTGTGQMIITICNYDKYQPTLFASGTPESEVAGPQSGTEVGHHRDTTRDTTRDTYKESKNPPSKEGGNYTGARACTRESPTTVLTELLGKELAKDVVDHRRKIGAPMTIKAAKLLCGKLSAYGDPKLGAETMIEKGWRGFEPHWMERIGLAKGKTNGRADKILRMADDLDRRAKTERDVDRGQGDGSTQPLLPTGE